MALSGKKTLRMMSMIFAILLCFGIFTPIAQASAIDSSVGSANAFNPPTVINASSYIISYAAVTVAGSGGSISVSFQITGTGIMDQIGATSITLYENGVAIRTYQYTSYPGMMVYNINCNAGSFTCQGTVGRSYYAFVVFQAGKGGAWDNRSMQTSAVTAKY